MKLQKFFGSFFQKRTASFLRFARQDPDVKFLAGLSSAQLYELFAGEDAARWVELAARNGLKEAQVRYGRMLLAGTGVAEDRAAALRWFATAARDGDCDAMNMVGRCHENGWGTAVDMKLAAEWYRKAATRGDAWAQYNLGHLLLDGNGVAKDHVAAFVWYSRAAAQGHARAMNLVGRCHEEGFGTPRNPAAAAAAYRASAEGGYFRGQYNFATLLLSAGRYREARDWFARAAVGRKQFFFEKKNQKTFAPASRSP